MLVVMGFIAENSPRTVSMKLLTRTTTSTCGDKRYLPPMTIRLALPSSPSLENCDLSSADMAFGSAPRMGVAGRFVSAQPVAGLPGSNRSVDSLLFSTAK